MGNGPMMAAQLNYPAVIELMLPIAMETRFLMLSMPIVPIHGTI